MTLETISREELELEKVKVSDKSQVLCTEKEECTRRGDYIRCYMDTYVHCPFYVTYMKQRLEKNED